LFLTPEVFTTGGTKSNSNNSNNSDEIKYYYEQVVAKDASKELHNVRLKSYKN